MQKKNWNLLIKACIYLMLLTQYRAAYAQVNLNITADNIKQSSLYLDNASTSFATVLSVAPTVNLSTTVNTLARSGGGTGVNSNLITARVIGVGGGVANLLNVSTIPTISLSTTPQPIYSSLLGVLASGAITLRYTIPNMGNTIWQAGAYSSNLTFALVGINLGTLSPTSVAFNLNVAAFITVPASLSPVQLNVNSLDYFRTQTISTTQSNMITTTVPVGIRVKANTSAFTYSNSYPGVADPVTATSRVNAQITSPIIGPAISVGTAYNNITTASGFSVPAGNQQTNVVTYSITPANLKSYFIQKGTYASILSYQFFDAGTAVQATTKDLTSAVTVTVADLAELKVNQANVHLEFTTAANYAAGVHTDMTAHLVVSKTTPYDVYVKASGTTMTSGANTLPVNLIDVMPIPNSGDNFNTITLSATPQKLASSPTADIDRSLNIRYSIAAAKAALLLNKPAGTYNTTITYSMIAP